MYVCITITKLPTLVSKENYISVKGDKPHTDFKIKKMQGQSCLTEMGLNWHLHKAVLGRRRDSL
jgi:hypothetical protein